MSGGDTAMGSGRAPSTGPGRRLGKYELRGEIGRGGMGSVYRGYDPLLDRWVAVKVLAPHLVWEQGFVERFLREARAAARLRHPSIVSIHDVGQEGDWYYFVMEYLEGQTLTDLVRKRGPLPLEEALRILRPLAEALDYAHGKGLVHRDVKPGNVIVNPNDGQVTLTDFGIARAAEGAKLTATGAVLGTPEYMSPEQARGESLGPRSDQYSLGIVAHELLSGRAPFQAESTPALLYKIVYEPPPPLRQARPDLPSEVERVLGRVLSKEPQARYASCVEFVGALERAATSLSATALSAAAFPAERPAGLPLAGGDAAASVPASRTRTGPVAAPPPAARRTLPVWTWAVLGGSVLLVLLVLSGFVLAFGVTGGRRASPTSMPAAATLTGPAILGDTSTPRPSLTPSPSATSTATHSPTAVPTGTATPASTETATSTRPPAATQTPSATRTLTGTPTGAPTDTSVPVEDPTATAARPSPVPVSPTPRPATASPTRMPTVPPTRTPTPLPPTPRPTTPPPTPWPTTPPPTEEPTTPPPTPPPTEEPTTPPPTEEPTTPPPTEEPTTPPPTEEPTTPPPTEEPTTPPPTEEPTPPPTEESHTWPLVALRQYFSVTIALSSATKLLKPWT